MFARGNSGRFGLLAIVMALLFAAFGQIGAYADETQTSIGEIPLCDLGTGTFQGFTGGLYPEGANTRPPEHEAAGLAIARNEVKPLNLSGEPDPDGKIVMISVGVSHTTMVFEVDGPNAFKPRADADPSKNPKLIIVDGASDGHNTAQWLGNMPLWDGQDPWKILNQRLSAAGVTPRQVQVVWLMSIGGFSGAREMTPFPESARNRQAGIEALVRLLKARLPNLKLAYTSQRPYSYSHPVNGLAPEPLNYYSGFGDKWMIENQVKGLGNLNFDPAKGKVVAPWLSWGPPKVSTHSMVRFGPSCHTEGSILFTPSSHGLGATGLHPESSHTTGKESHLDIGFRNPLPALTKNEVDEKLTNGYK